MFIKAFRKIKSPDRVVNQLQDNVDQVLSRLVQVAISAGQLIEGIDIVSGTPKTVNHGLGRELRGWIVTRNNANCTIWDSQNTNSLSNKTLILNASANCNLSIWVF